MGEFTHRLNPEIQPAVMDTPDLMSRRSRPTPLLLFHPRQPDLRLRVADMRSDAHQLMRRTRIAQRPSQPAVPCVALFNPAFKVRTNYGIRPEIFEGNILYRL
jgi:hypothetical protein